MSRSRALAIAFALVCAFVSPASRAGTLTSSERVRLESGQVVRRELAFDLPTGRYVGGVAYALVDAPPETVMAALLDVSAYRSILPLTLEATEVRRVGQDRWVWLRHGGRLATASYTARVRREGDGAVRFWLDPRYPHEIEDAYGYFRVERHGESATLLTYGAAVRLGAGLVELFFEQRVREYALKTPDLVRRYVESRRAAGTLAQSTRSPGARVD